MSLTNQPIVLYLVEIPPIFAIFFLPKRADRKFKLSFLYFRAFSNCIISDVPSLLIPVSRCLPQQIWDISLKNKHLILRFLLQQICDTSLKKHLILRFLLQKSWDTSLKKHLILSFLLQQIWDISVKNKHLILIYRLAPVAT